VDRESSSSRTTTEWSATTTLHVSGQFQSVTEYLDDPGAGTGTYNAHGNNGECSVAGSGSIDPDDFFVAPDIDPVAGTFLIEWSVLPAMTVTRSCPNGHSYPFSVHAEAKDLFSTAWAPDPSGVVTIHRTYTDEGSDTDVDYTITMTPLR
jgi:hypothetical protein